MTTYGGENAPNDDGTERYEHNELSRFGGQSGHILSYKLARSLYGLDTEEFDRSLVQQRARREGGSK